MRSFLKVTRSVEEPVLRIGGERRKRARLSSLPPTPIFCIWHRNIPRTTASVEMIFLPPRWTYRSSEEESTRQSRRCSGKNSGATKLELRRLKGRWKAGVKVTMKGSELGSETQCRRKGNEARKPPS